MEILSGCVIKLLLLLICHLQQQSYHLIIWKHLHRLIGKFTQHQNSKIQEFNYSFLFHLPYLISVVIKHICFIMLKKGHLTTKYMKKKWLNHHLEMISPQLKQWLNSCTKNLILYFSPLRAWFQVTSNARCFLEHTSVCQILLKDFYIIFSGTSNWKGSVGISRNCFEKRITLYRVHGYQSNENNRIRTIGEA